MNFENCKQIEINGKVFDCLPARSTNDTTYMIGYGRYSSFFLEAIGAKPVVGMPKKGDKIVVWNYPENKYIRVANGKTESGHICTYSEYSDGRLFFDTWENWKPLNPEELE